MGPPGPGVLDYVHYTGPSATRTAPSRAIRSPSPGSRRRARGHVVWAVNGGEETEREITWSRAVPAEFLAEIGSNGEDDNGNGLLDEHGLAFTKEGDRVDIYLTVEKLDENGDRPGRRDLHRHVPQLIDMKRPDPRRRGTALTALVVVVTIASLGAYLIQVQAAMAHRQAMSTTRGPPSTRRRRVSPRRPTRSARTRGTIGSKSRRPSSTATSTGSSPTDSVGTRSRSRRRRSRARAASASTCRCCRTRTRSRSSASSGTRGSSSATACSWTATTRGRATTRRHARPASGSPRRGAERSWGATGTS